MIAIDGSMGEGGGQIVRTSLALAICTGLAVTLHDIRARRRNPGLRAQHLAAVRAAAAICDARVTGDTVESRELTFEPGQLRPGRYDIDVGTAGSTMLVLQTILPALSMCEAPSEVTLHGGTHNPLAPTFEFVRDAYLPLLRRLGFKADISLERFGFYPRGGGVVRTSIEPLRRGQVLDLAERGPLRARSAEVLLARLPEHIAVRELGVLRGRLGLLEDHCTIRNVVAFGAGNALHVRIDSTNITTVFAGFGVRGVTAERVASGVAQEVERYLSANVAVDTHLADQLLLPMALTAGGSFSSLHPTHHAETNATVIQLFLPMVSEMREVQPERWLISLSPRERQRS